uniref:Sulfite oxidase n=1 Tax=Plectus sambesii TaxID=2011161 RepID=A0A914XBC9_9BILA
MAAVEQRCYSHGSGYANSKDAMHGPRYDSDKPNMITTVYVDPTSNTNCTADSDDSVGADPQRRAARIVKSEEPFNAETPSSLLVHSFVTPADLFFVRNHLPFPEHTDASKHQLHVEVQNGKKKGTVTLNLDDLKEKFTPTTITSAVQCAGNRRAEMSKFKKVEGVMWDATAIGNAKWTGVRLRDVLIAAGVDPNDDNIKHIHFEGADIDPDSGNHFGVSIPYHKAMSPEVLIAYEMNGEPLSVEHGYPLRLVVPGVIGARQVKWLTTIRTSEKESPTQWQQKDYRAFSPAYNVGDNVDPASAPAIQEGPVQSAFCMPAPGSTISAEATEIDVAGYAWSGGGRGIIRVEVSTDDGATWHLTELKQAPDQTLDDMWAWTLWRAKIPLPANKRRHELVCKATDRSYNTQPETPVGIYNKDGLLHNCWHRITIDVK